MTTFAHIINPVSASENAELNSIQQITFASVMNAKKYSEDDVNVKILTTQFKEARSVIPANFSVSDDLKRGVSDIVTFKNSRKLPLLRDILDVLYENSDADYLIYTNLDICLMPQFYSAINEYVKNGYDAFVINRRRVSGKYNFAEQLDQIYSEVGAAHTGYDTFVFKRSLYKKFIMKDLCIGIPKAGNDLFYNIFCFADNPKLFTDKHLTVHIGMELTKEWGDVEYRDHNEKEFKSLMVDLASSIDITKFPGAELNFFKRHFKWLMNPTFHYPTMLKADLKQLGKKRKRKEKKSRSFKEKYLEWLLNYINFD